MSTSRASAARTGRSGWAVIVAACASAAVVGACSSTSAPAEPASGAEVTVADQWVRSTQGIPDPSMTTVFGEFTNHTDRDLTIVSASNNLTSRTELHQMTMNGDVMVMGPAAGGIRIPAGSTTSLDPNSLHIMVMDLKSTIQPGDDVEITAKLSDGSKVTFDAIGKDYAGGNESYPGGSGMARMPGMTASTHG